MLSNILKAATMAALVLVPSGRLLAAENSKPQTAQAEGSAAATSGATAREPSLANMFRYIFAGNWKTPDDTPRASAEEVSKEEPGVGRLYRYVLSGDWKTRDQGVTH